MFSTFFIYAKNRLAEEAGFEPAVLSYTRFPSVHIRPLWHPSPHLRLAYYKPRKIKLQAFFTLFFKFPKILELSTFLCGYVDNFSTANLIFTPFEQQGLKNSKMSLFKKGSMWITFWVFHTVFLLFHKLCTFFSTLQITIYSMLATSNPTTICKIAELSTFAQTIITQIIFWRIKYILTNKCVYVRALYTITYTL